MYENRSDFTSSLFTNQLILECEVFISRIRSFKTTTSKTDLKKRDNLFQKYLISFLMFFFLFLLDN